MAYKKATRAERDAAQTDPAGLRLPTPELPGVRYSRKLTLKLDPGTGNSTILLGSSKAGKSTAMMHIFDKVYSGKDWIATMFASSPQAPVYVGKKLDRLVRVPTYDPRLIRMARAINRGTDNAYNFVFMLDDIIDQRCDKTLAELILTLRNSNISSVVCLQYSNLLSKMGRSNANNLLLFRFNSDEAIELVVSQFLKSHFRRMGVPADMMVAFYKAITADHGFIYLHTASDSMSFHRLPTPAAEKSSSDE
jgi:hypothetical protein